jgi:hypothetical protein
MHKVFMPNGPDLALRKKPGQRDAPQACSHCFGIVVALAKQAKTSPATAEHQRPHRRVLMIGPVSGQQHMKVVAGGLRVP